jgi:hypothetical protein
VSKKVNIGLRENEKQVLDRLKDLSGQEKKKQERQGAIKNSLRFIYSKPFASKEMMHIIIVSNDDT